MEIVGGRYRLEALLGEGGMGSVHWAVDQTTGRDVALKRVLADRRSEKSRRAELRFQREFHTLASLQHPRIVEVYDYGVDAKGPFYTMQLMEGEDLRDLMRNRGPIPAAEACRLLRDVASALATLHARGLIHRDLSPRNVRVVDGRAVLFDFGVLVNAGLVADVAGTPAFIAPEMLRGLPLDGRADLYALGVLAYGMLTGRKPYDARSLHELEACWAEPIAPPSVHGHVPEALEDLVLDLLALEPLARPPNAAVLIDRLTALGGLEPDPELAVRPGFVASAAMVGRDRELETLTRLLDEVVEGEVRIFSLEAESGAGKSRLLQELAIRSKLAGGVPVSVACEQADGGPFAAIAALVEEAFAVAPEDAARAAAPEAALLGRVFPSVRRRFPSVALEVESGEPAEDRMRLQAAVIRFVRALARARTLVILVDDIQRCDEASAAAFAALARAEVAGMLLGVARRLAEPVRATAAVASFASVEPKIRLEGLDAEGLEALLRSLFGDVANLGRLAKHALRVTAGSPMLATELARHLIESDVVRYEHGTWIVPEDVSAYAPPEGLADAMRRRVAALDARTRAVGEVLAVHGGEIDLERALALAGAEDLELPSEDRAAIVFGAIGELQQQGILVDLGDSLRFRHDSLREALLHGIEPERRRRLHRHVGTTLIAAGVAEDPSGEAEVGWHLHRGGDERGGAAMLERAGRRLYEAQALADCIAPLEAALEMRKRTGAPRAVNAELSYMLLSAGWVANREAGSRHADAPLDIYYELGGLEHARRWHRWLGWRLAFFAGLAWAGVRWVFRTGEARGPTPIRCLSFFAVGLSYATALAFSANQRSAVRGFVGRVDPFAAFAGHPPYAAYLTVHAMADIIHGRLGSAAERLAEAHRLATRTWLNPLTPAERKLADAACRAMRLLVDVNQFDPRLFDDLRAIDASGLEYYRLAGQTARIVRHRYRGEEAQARALEEATEATSLALGSWSTDLQRLLFMHPAYAFTHDVEGLKRSLDALERRVAEGMELETRVGITRAELLRERGDFAEALALLEPLYASLAPDDHLFRQYAASAAAQTALEAYRYDVAAHYARIGLAEGQDPAVRVVLPWLRCQRVLALADDALGRSEAAAERLEEAIRIAEELEIPVHAGELHEARARVAFAADDRLLFEVHRAKCAEWLKPTENPGLVAVVERLNEMDREAEVRTVDPRRRRPGASSTETTLDRSSASGPSSRSAESSAERDDATVVEGRTKPPAPGPRSEASRPSAEAREPTGDSISRAEDRTVASSPSARSRRPGAESEEPSVDDHTVGAPAPEVEEPGPDPTGAS